MGRKSHYEDKKVHVLALVDSSQQRHAQPPSVRELAEAVDVGVATMHLYLTRLAKEGLIVWEPKRHRSLRCTQLGSLLLWSSAP